MARCHVYADERGAQDKISMSKGDNIVASQNKTKQEEVRDDSPFMFRRVKAPCEAMTSAYCD